MEPAVAQSRHAPEDLASAPLVHWFARRVEEEPDRIAFRFMDLGIWNEVPWAEFGRRVEYVALALENLGVRPGGRVAMMGDATAEWLAFDFGAQSLGAIFLGIYTTMRPSDVGFILQDSEPRVFLAEDQEYVDKLLDAEEEAGQQLVDHVIVIDMRGMFQYRDQRLVSFAEMLARGEELAKSSVGRWQEMLADRSAEEVNRISYTSGTTGRPKGAMLTSRNLIWANSSLYRSVPVQPGHADRTISYMPPASPAEVAFSIVMPVLFGTVPHVPETMEARSQAFIEVCPTLLLAFPRMWEMYSARALVDIETGRAFKRRAYEVAARWSRRHHARLWAGETSGPLARLLAWSSYHLVFRHLLDKFGLRKARFVITGGAPVSPDVLRLWNIWGVQVQEIYGMTEVGGLATVQMDGRPQPGVAGRPLYGLEIRLDHDGEILLKSPGVFQGYWRRPDATSEVVDAEGWLRTGDIGFIGDDGNLRVIDRRSDMLTMSDGTTVPASEIEHLVKRSPYIREAMLAGDGRSYLTTVIEIDPEAVSEWARANRVLYTSFSSLIQSKEVLGIIGEAIEAANVELRSSSRPTVDDFRVLPKELDPEEGDEVTSTNKVRRRQLAKKFAPLIDEMYTSEPGVDERPASHDSSPPATQAG